jgi:ElaB/YqjD/DUF883 family membrane-anchored ribosome-binding protein
MQQRSSFDQPDWASRAENATQQAEQHATEFAEEAQQRTAEFGQEARENVQDFKQKAAEFGQQAKDRATELGNQAREKASEVGMKAKEMAHTGKEKAGTGLTAAGEKILERTENMSGVTGTVGRKIGSGLESTGHYLKDKQAGEIWDDVETFVKEHPVQSVAGAVVAGIIVGRLLK